jgi:hypothetical protein
VANVSPTRLGREPSAPADTPLDALLRRAVRETPSGPVRAWLAALLSRGESAESPHEDGRREAAGRG